MTTDPKLLLEELLQGCQEQIKRYKKQSSSQDSEHCAQIVRRAAHGDDEALGVMLYEISYPIVEKKCPRDLRRQLEDLKQEVALRLIRKFRHPKPEKRYRPSTFAAYHLYLNLTIRSAASRMRKPQPDSLERLHELLGFEPTDESALDHVDQVLLSQQVLQSLSNHPLQRAALYRRHVLGESVAEIAQALRTVQPEMTKKKVYKLIELALRKLRAGFDS